MPLLTPLRNRNFALVIGAQILSQVGDLMLYVALPVYIYAKTGSTAATGITFLAETLPKFVLGPVAGLAADRADRRRIMVGADALRALALLPLFVVHGASTVWIIYAVALVESCISAFFGPAKSAILMDLLDPTVLAEANSLRETSFYLTAAVAPAIGASLLAASHLHLGPLVLVDLATYLLSLSLLLGIRGHRLTTGTVHDPVPWRGGVQVLRDLRDRMRAASGSRALQALYVTVGLTGLGQGLVSVVLVPFARDRLHGGASGYGVLITALGVGAVAGGILVGSLGRRLRAQHAVLGGLLAGGPLLVATSFTHSMPVAATCLALVGFAGAAFLISQTTLIQDAVDAALQGRVFGAVQGADNLGQASGMIVGTLLGDLVAPSDLLLGLGAAGLVISLGAVSALRDGIPVLPEP